MYKFDASWGKKQFWDCLFEKGLVQAQEYCDDMYGSEPDIQGVKLMQCYGEFSIPKT